MIEKDEFDACPTPTPEDKALAGRLARVAVGDCMCKGGNRMPTTDGNRFGACDACRKATSILPLLADERQKQRAEVERLTEERDMQFAGWSKAVAEIIALHAKVARLQVENGKARGLLAAVPNLAGIPWLVQDIRAFLAASPAQTERETHAFVESRMSRRGDCALCGWPNREPFHGHATNGEASAPIVAGNSEVKPDGSTEGRSRAVDREGSSGEGAATGNAIRAGGVECRPRTAGSAADEEVAATHKFGGCCADHDCCVARLRMHPAVIWCGKPASDPCHAQTARPAEPEIVHGTATTDCSVGVFCKVCYPVREPKPITAYELIEMLMDTMRVSGARSISFKKLKSSDVVYRTVADRGRDVRDFYESPAAPRRTR